MPGPTRPKKRSSSKPAKRKISKKRSPPKRKPARAKRKTAKKRKPAKKRSKQQRSAAAKKGWAKRRKKAKLHEHLADLRMQSAEDGGQYPGWIIRREGLRQTDSGIWRRIAVEYSEEAYQAKRLQALKDLNIDFLTRDELADYLAYLADETEIDISDLYRMYLGYGLQVA